MSTLDASYDSCSEYTRLHAANFHYAFRHLDFERRRGIHALYAFCQHADGIVDGDSSPAEKQLRLNRLVADLTDDTMTSGTEAAWLLPALRDTIIRFRLPRDLLLSFLEGMRMDLEQKEFETFAQLKDYAWRVASVVGLLSIEIFGYCHDSVKTYAEQLGLALQLTNIIRDVRPDAACQRIYLPREDLERFGVSSEDILNARPTAAYQALMRFEADRAEEYYLATSDLLQEEDRRTMLPSEIMKNIYHQLLRKIRKRNFPLGENVVRLSRGTKLWITLRTRLLLLHRV
ncbi:MAG: squalene/phytoene synthase family protein [Candidatus Delongbacteria bacterium]|nr:squalene/phytoene synthase family protein [bacterium]MBL7032813.1 squalene/phytoene synthase family protein [Candidatus Delongbacteria bacterium]